MGKVIPYIFFAAWLLCGCSIESMFESPACSAVTILALIVAVACAAVMGHRD